MLVKVYVFCNPSEAWFKYQKFILKNRFTVACIVFQQLLTFSIYTACLLNLKCMLISLFLPFILEKVFWTKNQMTRRFLSEISVQNDNHDVYDILINHLFHFKGKKITFNMNKVKLFFSFVLKMEMYKFNMTWSWY